VATGFMFSDYIATVRDLQNLGVSGSVLSIVTFALLTKPFRVFVLDGASWVLFASFVLSLTLALENITHRQGFYALLALVPAVLIGHECYIRLAGVRYV
jgi:hypothetical protein